MIGAEETSLDHKDTSSESMASEDAIFQNVGSEVSIDCCGEELVSVEGVPLPATSTKGLRRSKSCISPDKIRSQDCPASPLMVSTAGSQASNLAQFITSIRPPSLVTVSTASGVGGSGGLTFTTVGGDSSSVSSPSTSGAKKATNRNLVNKKQPTAIAPAPSNIPQSSIITKVIMTPMGQQTGQQQIVFLSPVKGSSLGSTKQLVEVRPKPSSATIQLPVQGVNESLTTSKDTIAGNRISTNANKPLKPIAPNTSRIQTPISPLNPTSASTTPTATKYLVPASAISSAPGTPMKTISSCNSSPATGALNTTPTSTPTFLPGAGGSLIMVPAQLLQQQQATDQSSGSVLTPISAKYNQIRGSTSSSSSNLKQVTLANSKTVTSTPQRTNFVPIAPSPLTTQASALSASQILAGLSVSKPTQNGSKIDNDPNRPRKPCNCTKSQCLKLYCDCFANGEFCNACNCINCANNLKHEEERQKAIKQCLERNPHAFHPKIGKGRGDITERRHTKGCNCRRSGCLKNYCECYEAKILCTELCKCIACKNYEDSFERKTLMHLADAAEVRSAQQSVASKSHLCGNDFRAKLPVFVTDRAERLHCAFITNDVIEATCECLLAQAEFGEKQGASQSEIEKLILEEFGRCLRQIIESANTSKLAKSTSP